MKTIVLAFRLGTLFAALLVSGRAFAQGGCAQQAVNVGTLTCDNGEQYPVSTCNGGAQLDSYCEITGNGWCYVDGKQKDYTEASSWSDPGECGDDDDDDDGGGGGGGCGDVVGSQHGKGIAPDVCTDYLKRELSDFSDFSRAGMSAGLPKVPHAAEALSSENSLIGGETMKVSSLLLAGVCAAPMLCAQNVTTGVVNLKAITRVDAPQSRPEATTVGTDWAMCDSAGNVYILESGIGSSKSADDQRDWAAPAIEKIGPAGDLVKNFRVRDAFPDVPLRKGLSVVGHSFFATPEGSVFEAVIGWGGTVFVVEFARDGSIKAKTKLDVGPGFSVSPWHLAVFRSGEYLLSGDAGEDSLTPFTAVFTADGRMIRKIYEAEDEDARSKSTPAAKHNPSSGGNGSTDFVSGGGAAIGSDGNIYLMRGTSSYALVYVISSRGNVVRKLRIESADPDLVAHSIRSYAGRLAVEFDNLHPGRHRNLIVVTDLQGKSTASYEMGDVDDHVLHLAGYGSDGFTFTPYAHAGRLYLVKASLP